ncbi:MAG: HAMP domain-containing protein [Hyphomicrobium sp.]|nr:HAMP domain-containing protein [Hyphomicrobium sp.]
MTLRQRLLIRLAVVLGLSILVAAAMAYWRAAGQVREELHAALVVGEQVLVDAVKEIERAPNPFQQMRVVIERFSGGRHLKITLLDRSGQRVAASRLALAEDPAPEWFIDLMREQPETARVDVPKGLRDFSAFLIETDSRNEVQEFWEDIKYGLSVLGILACAVYALIYWTLGRELEPLANLNSALSRVAEGDFSMRLAETGSRDLKEVSIGFNEMAARLDATESDNLRLQEQLTNVQEEERAELARNLHDEIGPLLFSVGLDAAAVQKALGDTATGEAAERLASIREAVGLSQKHVLQILGQLRNGTVEDLGLETAVRQLIEFWKSRHPKLSISADLPEDGVSLELDPVVYRVVQESLSNAVRHGRPTQIDILVATSPEGMTRVMVSDNGGGLASSRRGNGLTGMNERVSLRKGSLTVRNRSDGKGTIVMADFPSTNCIADIERTPERGISTP